MKWKIIAYFVQVKCFVSYLFLINTQLKSFIRKKIKLGCNHNFSHLYELFLEKSENTISKIIQISYVLRMMKNYSRTKTVTLLPLPQKILYFILVPYSFNNKTSHMVVSRAYFPFFYFLIALI